MLKKCSFSDCDGEYCAKDLCMAHYQQVHRGYSFGPVRQYHFRKEAQDASASG